jgi:hypothetical protein
MDQENVIYVHIIEFYTAIRDNDKWFEGKWMQLEDIMLREISQERFLSHEQKDPKDKDIRTNKHDHIQTQT